MLVPGDLADRAHAKTIIPKAVEEFGKVDILVNNAAFQMSHDSLEEISDEEWDHTVAVNLIAMFILSKDAIPHMPPGGSIINSSSVNSDMPSPNLAAYAMTKAGIANFTASLAQMYAEKGIRANSVAPGPDLDAADPRDHAAGEGGRASASRCRWAAPGSRPSSRRSTCCWPATRRPTSPAPGSRSPAATPIL